MATTALRKILIPLDGSELSEQALTYACKLARAGGATLVLTRCSTSVTGIYDADDYVHEVRARLEARDLRIRTSAQYGDPVQGILDEVAVQGADLVIMATHGRSGLQRMLFGSVAEAVLARSQVPVLLIRSWQDVAGAPDLHANPRLLVPLDGSTFAEAALPVARDLAQQLRGELILMQAVPVPQDVLRTTAGMVVSYLDQQEVAFRREANDYLSQVRRKLELETPGLCVSVDVRMGEPSKIIVEAARIDASDLVVMATHGRTGLARMVLGSVAGQVLRGGTTPLLLVRPSGVAATPLPVLTEERATPAMPAFADVA